MLFFKVIIKKNYVVIILIWSMSRIRFSEFGYPFTTHLSANHTYILKYYFIELTFLILMIFLYTYCIPHVMCDLLQSLKKSWIFSGPKLCLWSCSSWETEARTNPNRATVRRVPAKQAEMPRQKKLLGIPALRSLRQEEHQELKTNMGWIVRPTLAQLTTTQKQKERNQITTNPEDTELQQQGGSQHWHNSQAPKGMSMGSMGWIRCSWTRTTKHPHH